MRIYIKLHSWNQAMQKEDPELIGAAQIPRGLVNFPQDTMVVAINSSGDAIVNCNGIPIELDYFEFDYLDIPPDATYPDIKENSKLLDPRYFHKS